MNTLVERICNVPHEKMMDYIRLKMAYDMLPPHQKAIANYHLSKQAKEEEK